jgi:hypothetical protein
LQLLHIGLLPLIGMVLRFGDLLACLGVSGTYIRLLFGLFRLLLLKEHLLLSLLLHHLLLLGIGGHLLVVSFGLLCSLFVHFILVVLILILNIDLLTIHHFLLLVVQLLNLLLSELSLTIGPNIVLLRLVSIVISVLVLICVHIFLFNILLATFNVKLVFSIFLIIFIFLLGHLLGILLHLLIVDHHFSWI